MEVKKREIRSIVIIDDDHEDFELVYEAIQQIDPNITVHYISGCDAALKYRHRNFDLILLDINMPQHDGFHWLNSIRNRGYADIPVIMYTNSLSPAHIAKSYEEGANLYFSKPDSFSDLIQGLKKLMALDWSDPVLITKEYKKEGDYATFKF